MPPAVRGTTFEDAFREVVDWTYREWVRRQDLLAGAFIAKTGRIPLLVQDDSRSPRQQLTYVAGPLGTETASGALLEAARPLLDGWREISLIEPEDAQVVFRASEDCCVVLTVERKPADVVERGALAERAFLARARWGTA